MPIVCRCRADLEHEMAGISASPAGTLLMADKGFAVYLKVFQVPATEANIIKQEMLSLGCDAAVSAGCCNRSVTYSDVLLLGDRKRYRLFADKLKSQDFRFLRELGNALDAYPGLEQIPGFRACGRFFPADRRYVAGILNLTPDSFYAGSRVQGLREVLNRAEKMASDGADLLDVGAESTRPGAMRLDASDEINRLRDILPELRRQIPLPLSIDTYKSEVARWCMDLGCEIVNDISGLDFDPGMAEVLATGESAVVLMHIKGTPVDMQQNPFYHDVISEVYFELERKRGCAIAAGISPDRIILDPGIGFGKRLEDNYAVLRNLPVMRGLGSPLMLGVSRKSLIGKVLDNQPEERLNGTAVLNTLCLSGGADILRVHDVKEAKEAVKLFAAFESGGNYG
ncbi:MAG: dihydropteroate synthase [Candidatus Wallbacteria bacterium]|nr:dihydropteroate synthase [Candidatus Wallbacteria bacterium]